MSDNPIEPTAEEITKQAEQQKFTGGRSSTKIRDDFCGARVMGQGMYHSHQCQNPPKHTEAGVAWCGVHRPSSVVRRRKINDQKMREKFRISDLHSAVKYARLKISDVAILHFEQKATFEELEAAVNAYHRAVTDRDAVRRGSGTGSGT